MTRQPPISRAILEVGDSYTVEHREGDAQHHYRTIAPNMRAAHRLLTDWAFQLPGWKDRAIWSPIRSA